MPSKIQKSYSKEQISEYLKKFDKSKMTIAQFCHTHKIAVSTFGYWRKNKNIKPKFIEMHIQSVAKEALEIKLPNGILAKVSSKDHIELLKSLMEFSHA